MKTEHFCQACQTTKPIDEFYKSNKRSGGFYPYCIECTKKQHKITNDWRKKLPANPRSTEPKFCSACKLTKPADDFHSQGRSKTGLYAFCKQCDNAARKRRKDIVRGNPPVIHESGTKRCPACKENLPATSFAGNRARYDHLESTCRECRKRPAKDERLKRQYGISLAEYEAMLVKQNHLCAICEKPETLIHLGKPALLSIDHCHVHGKKPRELLCNRCNFAIGHLQYLLNNSLLQKALDYLEKHKPVIEDKQRG